MSFSKLGEDAFGNTITVDQSTRRQGTYIIGASGTGKSVSLHNVILQDITQNIGVIVIDPNRDLITNIISSLPQHKIKDVILLDIANADYPFGLNIYECPNPNDPKAVQYTMDRIMHIWDRLFQIRRENPLMSHYLRNLAHTIIVNPGYTLADIPFLLSKEKLRKKLTANVDDLYVKLFWENYEHPVSKYEQSKEVASVMNKFTEYVQPLIRPIIGQSKSTINLRQLMDERKIVLLQLDPQLQSTTSLIGSTLVAMILMAAYSREELPQDKRKQVNVYIDELDYFATRDVQQIWQECRKFGVTLTVAHQSRVKLHNEVPELARSILGAATLASFRITSPDSEELAGSYSTTPPEPEEIIDEEPWGDEEIKTPTKDIVGQLLRGGSHPDPVVNNFVLNTLLPVQATAHKDIIFSFLNQVFYAAMTNMPLPNTFSLDFFYTVCHFFELYHYYELFLSHSHDLAFCKKYQALFGWDESLCRHLLDELPYVVEECIEEKIKDPFPKKLTIRQCLISIQSDYWEYCKNINHYNSMRYSWDRKYILVPQEWCELPEVKEKYSSIDLSLLTWELTKELNVTTPFWKIVMENLEKFIDYSLSEKDIQGIEKHKQEVVSETSVFNAFIWYVRDVMDALEKPEHHILDGSGQYRPVIRQIKHTPPQLSSAEMRERTANMLSDLQNLTAHARIRETIKFCPSCNTQESKSDEQCKTCGTKLRTIPDYQYCWHCGEQPYPNDKECEACGKPLKNEYTITVTPVYSGIRGKQLEALINTITQQNIKDGYVRRRSDVEKEIYDRMEPPDPPAQPQPAIKPKTPPKPQQPTAGTAAKIPEPDISEAETEPALPVVKAPFNPSTPVPTPRRRKKP